MVKANSGICKIEEIMYLDLPNVNRKTLYYLMVPQSDRQDKVYIPVEGGEKRIRSVISEAEAWAIIEKIPDIECIWVPNEKQREQQYKEAIKSCDLEQLVSIIKDMYERKQKRDALGKKNTAMDERLFKLAEEDLYSELAFAIGRNKSEIQQLITDNVKKREKRLSE